MYKWTLNELGYTNYSESLSISNCIINADNKVHMYLIINIMQGTFLL